MRSSLVCTCSFAVFLAACGGDEAPVTAHLRTDLVAGIEFREIDVALVPGDASGERTASTTAEIGEDYLVGRRVADFSGELATGSHFVRVRLRSSSGGLVAERLVRFAFAQEPVVVTVIITRDCVGVTCPAPGGDRMATECFSAECVPATCSLAGDPGCPPAECALNADCTTSVACARGVCVEGACLYGVDPDACAEGEYCAPDVGCMPLPMSRDGGVADAGRCIPGGPCLVGCEAGTYDCDDGTVCISTGPASAGTTCRAAISSCDVAETCDGVATACPDDEVVPVGMPCDTGSCDGLGSCAAGCTPGAACGTGNPCELGEIDCAGGTPACVAAGAAAAGAPCRGSVGPCDRAETCDGSSTACPSDDFEPATTTCRPAATTCDAVELCTGSSAACPLDGFAPAGTSCAAGSCDGLGTCASGCTPGAPCGTGSPCQVGARVCPSGTCMATGAAPAGTVCRPAAGACDVAETCAGSSCPADAFLGSSTVCRAAADACDEPERCGGGPGCPGDGVSSATTACRASTGDCDPQETCDGLGTSCPSDVRHPSTYVCRGGAGACDVPETCDGSSAACPSDALRGSETVCRTATSFCDAEERCSGAAACPPDAFAPNGTECGDGCGCNGEEACRDGNCDTGPPDDGSPCGFAGEVCYAGYCSVCPCIVPDCPAGAYPGCMGGGGCEPCFEATCFF